jgi:hypothetical protein
VNATISDRLTETVGRGSIRTDQFYLLADQDLRIRTWRSVAVKRDQPSREKIVEAAVLLFHQRGYTATSLDDILEGERGLP